MEAPLTPEQAQAAQAAANIRTLKEQAGNLADNLSKLGERVRAAAEDIALDPDASAKLLKRMAESLGAGALVLDTWEGVLRKKKGG